MRHYLVEGIVVNPDKMDDELMQAHQAYINIAMGEGKVLFSSLKSDMSSSVTIFKEKSDQEVWDFYNNEPFSVHGVVEYQISELQVHYHTPDMENWF